MGLLPREASPAAAATGRLTCARSAEGLPGSRAVQSHSTFPTGVSFAQGMKKGLVMLLLRVKRESIKRAAISLRASGEWAEALLKLPR